MIAHLEQHRNGLPNLALLHGLLSSAHAMFLAGYDCKYCDAGGEDVRAICCNAVSLRSCGVEVL